MSQNVTILVTGGAGFLGVHVCRHLRKAGYKVKSYDLAPFPSSERIDGVEAIEGDIRDKAKLRAALSGVDYVIHSAAALALAPKEEIDSVNAGGTKSVIEACIDEKIKRMVYVGTTAVYGMPKFHPIYEDAPLDPMGPYGIAKHRAEEYCREFADKLDIIRIRPKSFIGTGRLGIFQVLFDWIESGKRIYILGSGNNRFQLLAVEDLCSALELALFKGKPGAVYNIGAKNFGTVNEDVGALLEYAATGSRIFHIPSAPAKAVLRILELLKLSPIYRWVYDTADQDSFVSVEKAEAELGWQPRKSNRDTLTETYTWYLREGKQMAEVTGTGHRVAWKQGILKLVKLVS